MRFVFEDCELDEETLELRCRGQAVLVQPKVLDVLLYLVRHRERVVTRQELLDHVWGEVAVADASLARAVREVRRALGDDGDGQRIVKTIHGRGFRFVATVRSDARSAEAAPSPSVAAQEELIGREEVLSHLGAMLDAAEHGRGGALLIGGDPGIGKTRLLDRCWELAAARGLKTLASRCHEGTGVPAFWPWTQLFRGYLELEDASKLPAELTQQLAEVSRIVPEIRSQVRSLPALGPLESSESRFRVFDAVTRLFSHSAKKNPIAVFIDDLHWADASSLSLVEFFVREIRRSRLLLVCTYRDQALAANVRLEQAVGTMLRELPSSLTRLEGLTREQIVRFVVTKLGRAPGDEVVAALEQKTGGNPLFLEHLVELMRARQKTAGAVELDELRIPSEMRDAIGRHIEMLSLDCRRLLTLAAVVGSEFSLGVLVATGELSMEEILRPLEEAQENRVVRKMARQAGQYQFVHTLVRDALYDRLGSDERTKLHTAVAEALRKHYGEADDRHAEELAYQFQRASPRARLEHAVRYARVAADQAFDKAAYDRASQLYSAALETLLLGPPDHELERQLLLKLGSALGRDGNLPEASRAFRSAAALPRPPSRENVTSPAHLDAALLKDSFHKIVERCPTLTHRFYEILFTRFPEAKSLFGRNSAEKQERMLADALTGIIDHLEDAPWLDKALLKLGARHATYGVTDEMYEWVGVSLLSTLAEVAGADWTPRVSRAWTDAYAAISGLMLAGARETGLGARAENLSSPT